MMSGGKSSSFLRMALGIGVVAASLGAVSEASAENLIKQPGAHNRYSFELEPHLSLYYGGLSGRVEAGPGLRAAIPFMHNGPIDTINNNIGISFGIDTYFPGGAFILHMPAAFQWNFYFTDIISVIGEAGLAFNVGDCGADTCFDVDPVIQGGGRFQFDKVGIVVRVGYPDITVGANFQF